MSWFRHQAGQRRQTEAAATAAWAGPFAPAPSTEPPKFDRMVRTAAELVAQRGDTLAATAGVRTAPASTAPASTESASTAPATSVAA